MYPGTPEQRLFLVKQRQAELVHEAHQYRLGAADRGGPADNLSTSRFGSVRAWPAQLMTRVRSTLSSRGEACIEPCSDCVPC